MSEDVSTGITDDEFRGAASKKQPKTVRYEVYRVGEGMLQFLGPEDSTSDIAAITSKIGEGPQPGKYVAIPQRYLRVREVGVETVSHLVVK